MNPIEAISSCYRQYFCGEGRASRSEFWWFFLFYISLGYILPLLDGPDNIGFFGAVGVIGQLASFIPFITVSVRRAHDQNITGWAALGWLLPIIMIVIAAIPGTKGENKYGLPVI